MFTGELISIAVSISWTICALCMEYASKRIGSLPVNWIRITLSLLMTAILLLVVTGSAIPLYTDGYTWFWMSLSGLIGFVFGDICLYSAYVIIGSRFSQLFMTLAPPVAAILAFFSLNEKMGISAILGMVVTMAGIAMSILGKDKESHKVKIKLPIKGILLAIGAGVGQGTGIALSKIGMEYYTAAAANAPEIVKTMIPFSASGIRMIIATVVFGIIVAIHGGVKQTKPAFTDKKAALSIFLGTIFGPFVGVGFSLVAVQMTSSGVASTLMALSPIIILLPAWLWQKQKITKFEIAGAITSVIGVAMFFL